MFVLVGASHKSAPIAVRERLAIGATALGDVLATLREYDGVYEAMVLSTCNRVEILVRAVDRRHGHDAIRSFLADRRGLGAEEIERYTYQLQDAEAVRHLFRVAAGLDSMILGEPQILGQVRQAWLGAREHGATGRELDRMLQQCLSAARRARNETGISRNAISVAYAAAQLGRNIFGKLDGRRALLVGAGKMSFLVAKYLRRQGLSELVVASRTYDHAVELATRAEGRAVHWDDGLAKLAEVDIVVSCTDSSHHVLTRDDVARAVRRRRGEPLFLIDIAVPRDIDPAVNGIDNAYLYDIDGLQGVVDANLEERRKAAEAAETVLAEEAAVFLRWRRAQRVAPLIVALRDSMRDLGKSEIERVTRKQGALDEGQLKAFEQLAHGILQKVMHRPIRHLQRAAERGDVEACADLYHELFDIAPGEAGAAGDDGFDRAGGAYTDPDADSEPGPDDSDELGPRRVLRGGKDG